MPTESVARLPKPALLAAPPASLLRFQADGVAVEFTTPALASARVRQSDTDKLEVVFADLGGGSGSYVVPLRHIDKMLTMTVHDRTLCDEILHRDAQEPDDIRRAVLSVARLGLAGEKAARVARQAIDDEQKERLLTNVFLIRSAIGEGGGEPPSLGALASGANRDAVKHQLATMARGAGMNADAVYRVLEDWGVIVGAVGVPGMPIECRLRRLGTQVGELARQLRRWAEEEVSHAREPARAVAAQADGAAELAARQVAAIDAFVEHMQPAVLAWTRTREELRAAVARLGWMMNGWETNLRRWRDAAQGERERQQAAVTTILATIPPALDAAIRGSPTNDVGLRRASRKVQAHQDWKTGQIDYDMVRRLEALKELAL
jgi:hypothetical protein